MNNMILALPIILHLLASLIMLLFWKKHKIQRVISIIAGVFSIIISLLIIIDVLDVKISVLQVGGWQAPFGITLVADLLSAVMVLITSIVGTAVSVYSYSTIDKKREKFGFHPLVQFLLLGVNGAFLTGDLFNLYVWFEVLLISSFVLLTLGGKKQQLAAAIKYVTLNIIASTFFLAGTGIIYGLTGSLNMADVSVKIGQVTNTGIVDMVSVFFIIAFGIKSAVFPLFFWLPASYHTPPISIAAIFAGLLTKVGVYSYIRVFTLIFSGNTEFTGAIILFIAGFTMFTGVLGAASQMDIRKILSFHIISQIGYMMMGIGLFSSLALAGAIFYIIHHIIVKTNLFLISGIINKLKGTYDLTRLGGLYTAFPILGLIFLIPALSLAGIPPLSGFWAKFIVIKAGIDLESYIMVIVALLTGIFTIFSMIKIWNEAFWKDQVSDNQVEIKELSLLAKLSLFAPVLILALFTIIIGLYPEPFVNFAFEASEQLLNPENYIQKVLGGGL